MTGTKAWPRVWKLTLPYDRPPLSLNRELHWAKRRAAEKQIMDDVQWLARAAKLPKGEQRLRRCRIELVWTPSTKRTRDTDNPTPTLKKVIDGLVKHGLVIDDNVDVVESACRIERVQSGRGTVEVLITELLADSLR